MQVKANMQRVIVKTPLLSLEGNTNSLEDKPIPLLLNDGGIIETQFRDDGLGQTLFLELDNLPINTKIVKLLGTDVDGNNTFTSPLNFDDQGSLKNNLVLPLSSWQSSYLIPPKDFNGDLQFTVRSISKGNQNEGEKATENLTFFAKILPLNDPPSIINFDDLGDVLEDEIKSFNLKERFNDIDNDNNSLLINAFLKNNNGEVFSLPNWINLSSDGILTISPKNDDVGSYKLILEAVDPFGSKTSKEVSLSVGNINQKPVLNFIPQGWNDISDGSIIKIQNNITLNDSRLIDLSTIFSDLDERI